jgi:2-keto-4-pentenoate hydratase
LSETRVDPRILRGMEKQLNLREQRLSAGEKSIGWKVGFGAPASMKSLEIDAPLVGFLTDGILLSSDSVASIARWAKTAVEPEVAIHLGKDVYGSLDRETARTAVASLGPAIELADVNFPPTDIEAILEGNIYNRRLILGRPDPARAGCRLDGLTGRVYRDGVETASTTDLQAITGDFIDIVRHVADLLSVFGQKLCAGDIIIAGSIVPPILSTTNEEIRFFLDPIDSISVNLVV